MNTDCLNETEFHQLHTYNFHIKFYDRSIGCIRSEIWEGCSKEEVIDAFNDVQRARQDRDTLINEAEAFRNDIVPRARGEAAQLISEAEAYASEVVNRAKGDADRFNSIYKSYKLNPEVTESRIYLETMEKVFSRVKKIIMDNSACSSGVVPYLPLDQLKQKGN